VEQPRNWAIVTIAVLAALAAVDTVSSQPGPWADSASLGASFHPQRSAHNAAATFWDNSPLPGLSPLAYLPYVSRGAEPEPQPQARRLYLPLVLR